MPDVTATKFPPDFLWGFATSAHQVEGGNTENNWWEWEQREGTIKNGDRSGIGCDHWHRYEEDFTIMQSLHQKAYRFSLEWSRIFPKQDEVNDEAVQHYHHMIDALRHRGIEPFVTVHHFTEPRWFTKLGGIKRTQNVRFFRDYVQLLAREFSDKVTYWNTINEPNVRAVCGYFQGIHPPGEKGLVNYIKATRTLLRMHTAAYQTLKNAAPSNQVGLVKNIVLFTPYRSKSLLDRYLARFLDYLYNGITIRAMRTGKLPFSYLQAYEGLKESSDFIGLNYYTRVLCSLKFPDMMKAQSDDADPAKLCVGLGWQAYPVGLYRSVKRLWSELQRPVYITENGIGTRDDAWRQEFLLEHLQQLLRAIAEGIPVKGYFHWSFIDNFEWAEGYAPQFGLVHCDRQTLNRTIKASGYLYSKIAQDNAIPTQMPYSST